MPIKNNIDAMRRALKATEFRLPTFTESGEANGIAANPEK